jgi:hypothetical protein
MAAERSLRAAATAVRAKGRRACERSGWPIGASRRGKAWSDRADHREDCVDRGCQYAGGFSGGSLIRYTLMTLHSPGSKTFVNHVSRCSACSGRGRRRSPAGGQFVDCGCVRSDRSWVFAPNQVPRAQAAPGFDSPLTRRSSFARSVLLRRTGETAHAKKLLQGGRATDSRGKELVR